MRVTLATYVVLTLALVLGVLLVLGMADVIVTAEDVRACLQNAEPGACKAP